MTRWLVTGAGGMLGTDLVAALTSRGEPVTGLDRASLDVTDSAAVTDAVARCRPDVVVNCAAWTAVDDAEASEEQALAVNAGGAANLAASCAARGARLVQVSTDYVFAGDAGRPYAEDDVTAPRTAYGRTKLAGERAVLDRLPGSGYVVRTAWLYGAHGPNFVRTMIKLEGQRPTIDVVDDQQGQPTWSADVARQITALIHSTAPPGIYHATSSGQTTWFGLAREIFGLLGADPARVRPVPSSALTRPAPRPAYSVLSHDAWARLAVPPIGEWRTALHRAFPELLTAQRAAAAAGSPAGLRGPRVSRLAQAAQVGLAVGVYRQQPGPAGLLQRRGRSVLRRKHGLGIRRPLDAEVWVKGVHAVLTSRRVRGRAQVDNRRLVAEGGEGVPQPRLEEYGTSACVIQAYGLPAPVARRADPDVNDHVKDRAAGTRDVLCLAGRNGREVHTPYDSPAGHRAVGLRGLRQVPERLRQLLGPDHCRFTRDASSAGQAQTTHRPGPLALPARGFALRRLRCAGR